MVTWCHTSPLYIVSVITVITDKRLKSSTIVGIAVTISESSLEPKPLSVVSRNDRHDCYDGGSQRCFQLTFVITELLFSVPSYHTKL